MDNDIYKKRAKNLDDILSRLYADLESTSESNGDADTEATINRIGEFSRLEIETAKILLESEKNELKSHELAKDDRIESNQCNLHERELDIRETESEIHKTEIEGKINNEKAKLEVEKDAVKARFGGEALKVVSTAIGCVGTVVALKAAMTFEKADDGGIIPSKFISTIFKMLKN